MCIPYQSVHIAQGPLISKDRGKCDSSSSDPLKSLVKCVNLVQYLLCCQHPPPTILQGSKDITAVQVPDSNSKINIHIVNAEMKLCKCGNGGMSLRNIPALHT